MVDVSVQYSISFGKIINDNKVGTDTTKKTLLMDISDNHRLEIVIHEMSRHFNDHHKTRNKKAHNNNDDTAFASVAIGIDKCDRPNQRCWT